MTVFICEGCAERVPGADTSTWVYCPRCESKAWPQAKKPEAVKSNSTDGLCNVRFKIGVEIDWLTPAENTAEMVARDQHERKIKKEAFELSNRMTEKLLKRVV